MINELLSAVEPFLQHVSSLIPTEESSVVSPSDAANPHAVAGPSTNESGLIPTDRDRSNQLLSSDGGRDTRSLDVSTSRLRDDTDCLRQHGIRALQGGEFASGQNAGGIGTSKNADLGNMPGLAVTSSSTGMGEMIIVRAPSPGGPVEILDIPETEPQAEPTTQVDGTVSGYGQGEGRPVQQPPICPNRSSEASLQGRILSLEKQESPFLLGEKGEHWQGVKNTLGSASTQREYYGLLDVESRDLLIREKREATRSLLKELLARQPETVQRCIDYNADAAIRSFFEEKRETYIGGSSTFAHEGRLEDLALYEKKVDEYELGSLDQLTRDLKEKGGHSRFFKELVDRYFPNDS